MKKKILGTVLALNMALCSFAPAALADQQAANTQKSLSLQDAVNLALSTSQSYQQAVLAVEKAYDVRDNSSQSVQFMPSSSDGSDPTQLSDYYSFLQNDTSWNIARVQKQGQEDATTNSAVTAYIEVQRDQKKLEKAKADEENALKQLNVVQIMYTNGMKTQNDLLQAQSTYKSASDAVDAAEKTLTTAYQNLDLVLNMSQDQQPILTDAPVYAPLTLTTVDQAVGAAESHSSTVKVAQYDVSLAQVTKDLKSQLRNAASIDIQTAQLNADQAKNQLEQSVRALYNGIKSLEANYDAANHAVTAAQEAARVAQVNYNNGTITQAALVQAQTALSDAQASLYDLVCQHQEDVDQLMVLTGNTVVADSSTSTNTSAATNQSTSTTAASTDSSTSSSQSGTDQTTGSTTTN